MYEGKTVGVVVPAYNEEQFIGEVIDTLPEFVDRAYVIDDASTDDTWAEIEDHAAAVNQAVPEDPPLTDGGVELDPRVVPIQHEENRGVGGAIKTGYLRALEDGVDVTAVMGGDGQTEPDIVERIVAPVAEGKADYAKGNRLLDRDRDDMPMFRQVGNFMLTFLTKIASGYWKMMDPQNGSTAISHEALERVGIEDMYEGYGYCNDLLIRLNTRNVTVADVSRRAVYKDETSHIDYRTYVPKVSTMLLRGFLRRLRVKYFVNDFHPLPLFYYLGALGAGSGVLALVANAVRRGREDGPAGGLALFLVGCVTLLLAMVFDLEENRDLEVLLYDR
ncbi:glycosyltransferase family 2 protein [Halorarum salinum]|uniref:Glycosyltransferase family 2 protein n=1 Tax=Halorarum salinum TaxID=2743089 RepID=A0A7D5L8I5_9EURY|nr:glycosyltransferase family 2 protein [Halobaculum salinum]QLG60387.1 glycosyltransferase family 2 protein [Halobaculum salinum]